MPRFEDFLTLNSFIYDAQPPATITVDGPGGSHEWVFVVASGDPSQPGYYGAAYRNVQTNEIVIVNRGTNDLADLVTDLQMALDVVPDQLEQAELFYNQVKAVALADESLPTLSITGHSLGGSLTQLLVASHADDEINGAGVFGQTFNAFGVKGLLNDLGLPEADYAVTNWVMPTDVVGNLAEHIGSKHTLASLPFSFLYPAGPPGVLAFLYDSHKIAQVRDTFIADNSHPLLAETREFLLQTYVTDFEFPVTIDGQVIVGGNNRINVGNELHGSSQNDLLFGGLPDDRIHGGDGQDVIYAGDGHDTLWGEAGADIMVGEDGDDTYHVDDPNDRVIEAVLGGTDTVTSTVSYILSNNVEQLVLVGEDALDGTGNEQDNVLIGNNAANVLDGGFGKDAMAGGAGDDIYIVDNSGDAISEAAGEGTDTVRSSADYVLPANVEQLMLTGAGNISGTGNELNNEVVGNEALNVLTGGLGDDLLVGGAGFDTYLYTSGDGLDRIEDAYGQNAILFDQQLLQGGIREAGGGAYTSLDGRFTYAFSGTDLVVNGVLTLNENFQNGQFGIRLFELPAYAAATRSEFVKVDHYEQVGTDQNGNPIYEPVYAPFFDDNANTTTTTTDPGRLVPSLGDDNNLIHALGGNDTIISGAGDDQLYGEDGNDEIYGKGGHDRIYGGAGHDTINGDDSLTPVMGNDYLDGGDGDDLLQGSAGSDVVLGGAGNDKLNGDDAQAETQGTYGADVLDGGEGDDELHGGGGADVLTGGTGRDLLIGDTTQFQGGPPEIGGADTLVGGSGDDQLFGLYGDDVLDGGSENDLVNGQDGNDVLYGGDGNDTLSGDLRVRPADGLYDTAEHRGAGGNDLLDGGVGIDFLYGGEGDDVLRGGADSDTLYGDYNPNLFPISTYAEIAGADDTLNGSALVWGNDVLDGGDGNDILYGGDGNDRLSGGTGDDGLLGGDGADHLSGGDGSDNLDGGFGDDELHGGTGNDRLFAGQGTDVLYGDDGDDYLNSGNEYVDTGNSVLIGGAGNDAYVVDSAADTVMEEAASGTDTVESFVSYTLPDNVENFLATASGIVGTGNALDNEMRGSGSATLDGRAGNDTLINGRTYVFGLGYGTDTIVEDDPSSAPYFPGGIGDAMQFAADVLPSHVRWQRSGDDLLLSLDGTTDQLRIPSFYTVAFNQGTYLFSSNIFLPGPTVTAGGNPYYVAPSQVEQFQFADGTVWGPEAFDAPMIGAYHANTYRFGRGSGQDTILDFDFTSDQATDLIEMGADVLPSDLTVSRVGDNVLLSIDGTSDRLTVQSHFASVFVRPSFSFSGITVPAYRIEQIQFANGTVWDAATLAGQIRDFTGTDAADFLQGNQLDNTILGLGGDDTLHGQQGADVLDGGAGDDTLFGGTGADTYLFGRGSGHDTVYDDNFNGAEIDTVRLASDVTPDDVTLQANAENGLVLGITGTGDQLTLRFFLDGPVYEIEQLAFADGTTWDTAAMRARATGLTLTGTEEADFLSGTALSDVLVGLGGDDFLDGREGDDTLRGDAGNDELAGRAGVDLLEGGEGNDIYYFNPGDGTDTIADTAGPGEGNRMVFGEGIAQGDLMLTQNQNILTIQVGAGGDEVRLTNFDPTGANGSLVVETLAFADGSEVPLTSLLTPTITGTENDDVLYGTNDAEMIDALGGSDYVEGRGGNDQVIGGAGHDQLFGNSGDDVLVGGAGHDRLYGEYAYDIGDTPGNDVLDGGEGDDSLTGNGGDDVLLGGAGNDGLSGDDGNDLLAGGLGNDVLTGDAGADRLRGGDGDDWLIVDGEDVEVDGGAGYDTVSVQGTIGATLDLATVEQVFGGAGDDSFTNSAPDRLVNLYVEGGGGHDTVTGGAGNDQLIGRTGHDTLVGGAGNDTLSGENPYDVGDGPGNDVLDGGDGNDTLSGGSGDDVLMGGAGNDALYGDYAGDPGTGNDILEGGDGNDHLYGNAGADTLLGGDGDDTLVMDADDILVDGGAGYDRLLVQGGGGVTADLATFEEVYGGAGNDVFTHSAPDSTVALSVESGAGDDQVTGAAGNDLIYGRAANDTLVGGAGHDRLYGEYAYDVGDEAGNDVLDGGAGDDYLQGDAGNDTLVGGAGNDGLNGGAGNDHYRFDRGFGQDLLNDTDATPGNTDTVLFGTGINPLDLIFRQDGNDLEIARYNSTDQLTIQNWYTGSSSQTETIQAGNGQQLLNTQVEQLIQAMAGFSAQTGLTWEQAIAQRPEDVQAILAANWQ